MYQIDNATAVASPPAPTSAGTAGYFTDGNPATATPATRVPAEFMNAVMRELLSILTAGSVAPSKSTHDQVLTALKAILLQKANNLSDVANLGTALTNLTFAKGSGYLKIPNPANTAQPTIIQWGAAAQDNTDVSFPIAFPNGIYLKPIGCETNATAVQTIYVFQSGLVSNSGFKAFVRDIQNNIVTANSINWIAIGY